MRAALLPGEQHRALSEVRGMGKSKDTYADTMVPGEVEECLMLSHREPGKYVVGACSHSVSS